MRRALLALLAVGLLALAGCGPQQPQQPDLTQPYIGGTGGLAMSFAAGMPPPEIFDDGQTLFSIGILLENLGESKVGLASNNQLGYVEIIGINPVQFGKFSQQDLKVTWAEAGLELQGARRGFDGTIVAGDTALVQITDLSYIPNRFGNDEVTIRANACYEYRTFTDTEVCIKDNVLENALDDTICTLSGAKTVHNSGGPVHVTQVTQNPAGSNRIQITFVVENVGNGIVFEPASQQGRLGGAFSDDACLFNVGANPARNVVDVHVSIGDQGLYLINCPLLGGGNRGQVRMFGGAPATISCTVETGGSTGSRIFTDSLHIDLWYTYLEWIETPILVRDTNVGFTERGLEDRGQI